jgi:hypothetical protein
VLGRKDGAAGSNPPDQGQAEGLHEADAPRPAFFEGDGAFGSQGTQVGFGGIGGAKTKGGTDFSPGGRAPFQLDGVADELKDFLLAGVRLSAMMRSC